VPSCPSCGREVAPRVVFCARCRAAAAGKNRSLRAGLALLILVGASAALMLAGCGEASSPGPAQHVASAWTSLNQMPTSSDLGAVVFPDASHGWAVGAAGTIAATADRGVTWTRQASGTGTALHGVDFADAQHGWAVGDSGTILGTTDGGVTWTRQASGTVTALHGADFVDAQHGWADGDSGTIVATIDGGATWTEQSSGTTQALNGLSFVDAQHGWAVGDAGTIMATGNGGGTWAIEQPPTGAPFGGASFVDAVLLLESAHGVPIAEAILVAERCFRGSDGSFAGLGRERIYLETFLRVREWLATRAADERVLASGQISLDSIATLRGYVPR